MNATLVNDFKSWYTKNSDFFVYLDDHNSVLFNRTKDIILVLAYIVDKKEDEISDELSIILDSGFSYLFTFVSDLQLFLKSYFGGSLDGMLKYDEIINFYIYIGEIKDILKKDDMYSNNVSSVFDYILNDIEDIMKNKRDFNNKIEEYNTKMLSVMPMEGDFLTIPELFEDIRAKLYL